MDSRASQPNQTKAASPFELSRLTFGSYVVKETTTQRPIFHGPKVIAEKWLKELSGAYVRGVEHAIGQMQDRDHDRFERGEVLNGRNPRGDARLLGALSAPEDVSDPHAAPLVSLGQGDYRQDVSARDVIGGGR